jgi:hypothetical protein
MDPDAEPDRDASKGGRQFLHAQAPDVATVAAELERIRASVHRWIGYIEQHLPETSGDVISKREQQLALATEKLERDRRALQADIDRREEEWDTRLEAIERDRLLLAEAWERLESDQLALAGSSRAASHAAPPAPVAPSRIETSRSDSETAVSRAILRQFETLRQDVRTQAGARRSG